MKTSLRTTPALLAAVLAAAVGVGGASAKTHTASRAACAHLQAVFYGDMNIYAESVRVGSSAAQQAQLGQAMSVLRSSKARGCGWA
jgi:hypothetical protein